MRNCRGLRISKADRRQQPVRCRNRVGLRNKELVYLDREMLARILGFRFGAVMAVFAASVGVRVAEADACRAIQAKCDRKERHGANRRVSDFPKCTQYAHFRKV